jgi:protein TonB
MRDDAPRYRRLGADDSGTGAQEPRVTGAAAASFVAHAVMLLVLGWAIGPRPEADATPKARPASSSQIVWIETRGLEGGGGGAGQRTPAPAQAAQQPGRDAATVKIRPPVMLAVQPTPKAPTPPEPSVVIPAIETAAGLQQMVGAFGAAPTIPTGSLGPGHGDGAGAGKGTGSGDGDGGGLNDGQRAGNGGNVYFPGNGTTAPQLVRDVKPTYTPEAMRARVQGLVTMQAIVLADGSVGSTRILRSLDPTFGLDEEALRTIKQWRFAPGRRQGRAVPVLVEIEMMFTLR